MNSAKARFVTAGGGLCGGRAVGRQHPTPRMVGMVTEIFQFSLTYRKRKRHKAKPKSPVAGGALNPPLEFKARSLHGLPFGAAACC